MSIIAIAMCTSRILGVCMCVRCAGGNRWLGTSNYPACQLQQISCLLLLPLTVLRSGLNEARCIGTAKRVCLGSTNLLSCITYDIVR